MNRESRPVGALVKILVEVREDGDGGNDVDVYMTVEFVDEFGDVGDDPTVVL
jgi:hypothetical protein